MTDDKLFIVSELAPNGEMFDYVQAAEGLSESQARHLITELINGVEYIHSLGVTHRDLKLENVLFDNDCRLKIIDFGCAKDFKKSVLKTRTGTENYMAPEINNDSDQPYDGPPVDVFAMGAILFIMTTAQFCFEEVTDNMYKFLHENPWEYYSKR